MSLRQRNGWAGERLVRDALRANPSIEAVFEGAPRESFDLLTWRLVDEQTGAGELTAWEVKCRQDGRRVHLTDGERAMRTRLTASGVSYHVVTVRKRRDGVLYVEDVDPPTTLLRAFSLP